MSEVNTKIFNKAEETHVENTSFINGINYPWWVGKVKRLDEWQKLKVYMHYYCVMLSLKYNFEVVDKMKVNWQHGWGNPDKEYLGLAFYSLWKDIRISDFAQRWWVETYGIYDWYWKHESEFNFA